MNIIIIIIIQIILYYNLHRLAQTCLEFGKYLFDNYMLFVLGDILSCERCGLVIDQIMVNSSINGIGKGILMLFASYFILNIAYPNEIGLGRHWNSSKGIHFNNNKSRVTVPFNVCKYLQVNKTIFRTKPYCVIFSGQQF